MKGSKFIKNKFIKFAQNNKIYYGSNPKTYLFFYVNGKFYQTYWLIKINENK